MPAMTPAEMKEARYGGTEKSHAVNMPFEQPAMDAIAKPEEVERYLPNPRLNDGEPARHAPFKLHQFDGKFQLPPREKAGGGIRTVREPDIEEFMLWGFPRILEFNPRATREYMLPFLRTAINSNEYKVVRTDNCFGLFVFGRFPWEPAGEVADIGVYNRPDGEPKNGLGNEVVRVYRAGLEWAVAIRAARFRFASDNGYDLKIIAQRIGMDMEDTCVLYKKALIK
jgi:hypothetical protein